MQLLPEAKTYFLHLQRCRGFGGGPGCRKLPRQIPRRRRAFGRVTRAAARAAAAEANKVGADVQPERLERGPGGGYGDEAAALLGHRGAAGLPKRRRLGAPAHWASRSHRGPPTPAPGPAEEHKGAAAAAGLISAATA